LIRAILAAVLMTSIAAIGSTQHGNCVPGWSLDGNTAGLWARCNDGNEIADLFARLRPSLTSATPHERVLAAEIPSAPANVVAPVPTFGPQRASESRGGDIPMFSEDGSPLTETGAVQPRNDGSETSTTNGNSSGFGDDSPVPSPDDSGPLLQCEGCLTSRSITPRPPSGPGTSGGSGGTGGPSGPIGPTGPIVPPDTLPVSGIPEPSVWTLIIIGFGFVGATKRRWPRATVEEE
jgi:hypothetical protein